MNLGESILFATIMTLMEEINSNKFDNSAINAPSYNNDFEIEFTFDHSQAKDKLIKLANKLFSKADEACGTFNELDAEPLITALINSIIFECFSIFYNRVIDNHFKNANERNSIDN